MPKIPSAPKTESGKIEIRADQLWIDRVDEAARRLGLKRSAYIRMIVTREMDRNDEERSARSTMR